MIVRQRTPQIYREAIFLSLEITILLGLCLLLYTVLLILQQVFSFTGVILLFLGAIIYFGLDYKNNSGSASITAAVCTFKLIGERLGSGLAVMVDKLCNDQNANMSEDFETRKAKVAAIWASYVGCIGVLVQVFLKYPISMDTLFICGFIAIVISANHVSLFSSRWELLKRNVDDPNLGDQTLSKNKVDADEIKEVIANLEEEKQKWMDEKSDLIKELNNAKEEISKLVNERKPYSMFGNFDWD